MKPWEIFLDKYRTFGEKPSRDTHARLFAPDATIAHPGMAAPMPAPRYVDFIAEALTRLGDFHLIPVHWAANANTLFVEARNTAVVNDKPVEWPATYVVTLAEDGMVTRARAYYDRTEILMHFEPELMTNHPNAHVRLLERATVHGGAADDNPKDAAQVYARMVRPYAENGRHPDPVKFQQFYTPDAKMINPGFERPLRRDELPGYYKMLMSQIRNLQLHLERWAVAPRLLFVEWTVTGEIAGQPFLLPNTDRFTLRDMLATEGVAYFDELAVRALVDPTLARFATLSFGNLSTERAPA
ncbi:MAG TPA: nuclear transport factor 2 family protein [Candidatus Sulfotelmatobacter sp.]|nr:nuclear transport factor 2 family protein [Candidatus Sulfotelmatobacter sp.]